MSTLWTPSGEHPIGDRRPGGATGQPSAPTGQVPRTGAPPGGDTARPETARSDADPVGGAPVDAAQAEEIRRQLAEAPAEVVVANHCYGLFELAAIYLSQVPPLLEQARLAIDAFGSLVEGLTGRLGDVEPSLHDALAQLRLGYVQMSAAQQVSEGAGGTDRTTN